MECRIAEGELVPLGALEPEVHVVLPGEADAAVHLHGPVGRARVYVRESGLSKSSGAGSLARACVKRVSGVPYQGTSGLDLARYLCGQVLQGLKRGDGAVELRAHFGVLDRHLQRLLRAPETVRRQRHASRVDESREHLPTLTFVTDQSGLGHDDVFTLDFIDSSREVE